MRVTIIGAGNMGCVYGANLARIGERVTLVDVWQEHVDQMSRHGLAMDGLHGEFVVEVGATTDPATIDKADAVIVCVNTYSTRAAAETARTILKPDGFVLTVGFVGSSRSWSWWGAATRSSTRTGRRAPGRGV